MAETVYPRDGRKAMQLDADVERVARALWAKEFDKPMEEMRDEPPNEGDANPGWWVEDVWDSMLDTARTAIAAMEGERITSEEAETLIRWTNASRWPQKGGDEDLLESGLTKLSRLSREADGKENDGNAD